MPILHTVRSKQMATIQKISGPIRDTQLFGTAIFKFEKLDKHKQLTVHYFMRGPKPNNNTHTKCPDRTIISTSTVRLQLVGTK